MQKSQSYKTFTLLVATLSTAELALTSVFNWLIDPYDIFRSPQIEHVNVIKPALNYHARLNKALELIRRRPRSLIFGSSRAALGLDPNDPALSDLPKPLFNAGLDGATISELRAYILHAIANQPDVKCIILGLDFSMFLGPERQAADFKQSRLEKRQTDQTDIRDALLSLDAVRESMACLSKNMHGATHDEDYYLPSGQRNPLNMLTAAPAKRWSVSLGGKETAHTEPLRYNKQLLKNVHDIVDVCKQKNIDLHVFISPAHYLDSEAIRSAGNWLDSMQWKRDLVQIVPFWDFSGYNSITTEPISQRMQNYIDALHYTPRVGSSILQTVFGKSDSKNAFGTYCTTSNIDTVIQQDENAHSAWSNSRPEALEDLKAVQEMKSSKFSE